MKKINFLSMLLSVAAVVALIVVSSCTKEGPAGPAGKDGEDGIDGKDGNATCGVCHDNSELVETKILQWGNSIHANGGNYERNGTSCAPCHTSQGFKDRIVTGEQTSSAALIDPANINCYTCHFIHDTYTTDDWSLRTTEPVALWIDPSITIDLGKGNLCVQCHQPRPATIPDATNPDGTFEVTSSRFGPHHGPQSTTLTGNAFYMVGSGYTNSQHKDAPDGCISCHMADAFGSQAGGHTWKMTYEYHGATEWNLVGCVQCHGSVADAEAAIEEWEAEYNALITELGTLLFAEGIITESGSAVAGTYTNRVAGACWNWRTLVIEDRSMGIHNPKFVKKILENSIASLQ